VRLDIRNESSGFTTEFHTQENVRCIDQLDRRIVSESTTHEWKVCVDLSSAQPSTDSRVKSLDKSMSVSLD